MSRILILEPDAEIRALYERAISRLGYTPSFARDAESVDPTRVDAVVVEPASQAELGIARVLRSRRPTLPIICASVFPSEGFGFEPAILLDKPFSLAALEHALATALAKA